MTSDTERMDWIEKNMAHVNFWRLEYNPWHVKLPAAESVSAQTLREAIDLAIAEEKK